MLQDHSQRFEIVYAVLGCREIVSSNFFELQRAARRQNDNARCGPSVMRATRELRVGGMPAAFE